MGQSFFFVKCAAAREAGGEIPPKNYTLTPILLQVYTLEIRTRSTPR